MQGGDLRGYKNLVSFSIERFDFGSHLCSPFFSEPVLDLSDLATVALLRRHFSPALDALVSTS
jgi:hypothetical protein